MPTFFGGQVEVLVLRTARIVLAVIAAVCLLGIDGAGASSPSTSAQRVADALGPPAESGRLARRVQVASPWGKDDTVGDAARPEGDLRRIIVANGNQHMSFTWRTVATPLWDTAATDRITGVVFDMDWQNTTAPPNRSLVVEKQDGVWTAVILNARNQAICSRTGGVRVLTNHRFNINAPVQQCLGGAHVLRVASGFVDDLDDTAVDDTRVDFAPNSRGYGPFIRLPARSRSTGESTTVGGWTVH